MTTNSRKGDRYPCSEQYSLANRKDSWQVPTEEIPFERTENATLEALDMTQGRRMSISQDSDGGTPDTVAIPNRAESLNHQLHELN